MSRYKNILLDIDGTLIDTEQTAMLSLQQTVKDLLGKDMSFQDLHYFFGIPSRDTIRILQFPDQILAAETWERNYREQHNLSHPFPGVEDFLQSLKDKDFKLGVISSRRREENEFDHNFHPLEKYFGCVICAEDSVEHKPSAGPVLAYLDRTGAKREECVYVGDALADSLCASAAGVDFILMCWSGIVPEDVRCNVIAHNFDELFSYICQRN
jgi:HAD superfamily hydrolase (TIGR01549 family)